MGCDRAESCRQVSHKVCVQSPCPLDLLSLRYTVSSEEPATGGIWSRGQRSENAWDVCPVKLWSTPGHSVGTSDGEKHPLGVITGP